ncbi:hypothetical protein ACSSV4_002326 [Roseovarius sp. MBR-154]|jgi:hypothetical protein
MRIALGLVMMAALGACAPAIPDSGAGVGFGDYDQYQREKAAREAALAGNALPAPDAVSSEPLDATGQAASDSEAERLAAETQAALAAANSGEVPVQASPSNPPPPVLNSQGISQENDFDAVGSERSIEEDAARIAQNRAQYQVIEPEAIGTRPDDASPNIVAYALANRHPVGTQLYSRVGFNKASKFERNCAQYSSSDEAQIDFLHEGGPERDRLGLDPDGDGFACDWDPTRYQNLVGG